MKLRTNLPVPVVGPVVSTQFLAGGNVPRRLVPQRVRIRGQKEVAILLAARVVEDVGPVAVRRVARVDHPACAQVTRVRRDRPGLTNRLVIGGRSEVASVSRQKRSSRQRASRKDASALASALSDNHIFAE
eukprot:scaffold83972_cov75-Phaeocystis_antarctica.AAC.2